jgi:hypothetical protein
MGVDEVQERIEVKSQHHIQLAFMECFISCVLTYVQSRGLDHRLVLLDYWNLGYQFRTLQSSKDARQLPLKTLYGIELLFQKGNPDALLHWVREGHSLILFCSASKLAYFPREYLGMESSGFQHSVLIYGWDEEQGKYMVADPTVKVTAMLDSEQLLHAGSVRKDRDELHYFTLTEPPIHFIQPDMKDFMMACTKRMLDQHDRDRMWRYEPIDTGENPDESKKRVWQLWVSNRHVGVRAWDAFSADLSLSRAWPPDKRSGWIKRNTKMIASIKRLRTLIWHTYIDFAAIGQGERKEGQHKLDSVTRLWNSVSFQLLKLENKQMDGDGYGLSLMEQIEKLQEAEEQFLAWLYATVRRGKPA